MHQKHVKARTHFTLLNTTFVSDFGFLYRRCRRTRCYDDDTFALVYVLSKYSFCYSTSTTTITMLCTLYNGRI